MEVKINTKDSVTTAQLIGRLDTPASQEISGDFETLAQYAAGTIILDCTQLEYISSAGLRVLLSAQKTMNKQGSMVVRNVRDEVNEIFDVTGFSDILTIE